MGVARFVAYYRKYGFVNTGRKAVFLLIRGTGGVIHFIRKVRFLFYFKCWVRYILGKVYINGTGNDVRLGKDVAIYPHTVFEVSERAHLQVGDHFTLSYGAVIACHQSISIGDNVSVGEYTSIRDTTHTYSSDFLPYNKQPDQSESITIGNNVWIGRGCIILPGTIIEDGVIVGANSVVKGRLKAYHMYAGAPARLVKRVAGQVNNLRAVFKSSVDQLTIKNNITAPGKL